MAVLDNILERYKQQRPIAPVEVLNNGLSEGIVPGESIQSGQEERTKPASGQMAAGNNGVAMDGGAVRQELRYPNKPESMNDDDYTHLLKYYSPEAINRFTSPYDPSTNGNYLERLFMSSRQKPSALDPRKQNNAKMLGAMGDSFRLLGEMFASGRGAYISKRDRNDSAIRQVDARQQEMDNLYLKQLDRYNDGLYDARSKDFLQGLKDYQVGSKGIQGVLDAKQRADQKQKQFDSNQQRLREKDMAEADRRTRNDKARIAQGWARVTDSANRTSAYIKRVSSGTGRSSNYQVIIDANPNDSSAQNDQFNNRVRVFNMTKGEVDRYARAALNNPDFMTRHPELVLQKPDLVGQGSYRYKPNTDIAAAYVKELYDNDFVSDNIPDSTNAMYRAPWLENDNDPGEDEDVWGDFEIIG